METLDITTGQRVSCKGKEYIITRVLDFSTVLAQSLTEGLPERLPIDSLSAVNGNEAAKAQPKDLVSVPDKDWAVAQRRFEIIRPFLERTHSEAEVMEAARKLGLSAATIYRWVQRYRDSGFLTALLPLSREGGKGRSRLTPEVDAVIKGAIEDFYFTTQRKPIQKTCLAVIERCKTAKLAAPHPNTIRKRIAQLSQEEIIRRRQGRKRASELFEPKPGKFEGGERPLAMFQIDHTKLDIILVDEVTRQPIGRPWITLALDVYSRMVAGFHISFDPPGEMGTGLCIAHAILPKEKWLVQTNVAGEWPCWGIPKSLHFDNAREFWGGMLKRACAQYGIEIRRRPRATPHYGGHIERMLGTVLKEIQTLPGTTFSSPQQRKEYKSEEKASLTLKELESWVTTFLVSVYHQRVHTALGKTPVEQFKIGVFGLEGKPGTGLPPRPTNERRIRLDFMPYQERTIQFDGVVIDGIKYYHDVLRKWINATEKGPRGSRTKRKFIFKRDPRDISVVYFYDPDLEEYFAIPTRNTARPAISIWEYRAAERKAKEAGKKKVDEVAIFAAVEHMRQIEAKAVAETRKAKRAAYGKRAGKASHKQLVQSGKDPILPIPAYASAEIKPFDDIDFGTS
jgi:putative transposase